MKFYFPVTNKEKEIFSFIEQLKEAGFPKDKITFDESSVCIDTAETLLKIETTVKSSPTDTVVVHKLVYEKKVLFQTTTKLAFQNGSVSIDIYPLPENLNLDIQQVTKEKLLKAEKEDAEVIEHSWQTFSKNNYSFQLDIKLLEENLKVILETAWLKKGFVTAQEQKPRIDKTWPVLREKLNQALNNVLLPYKNQVETAKKIIIERLQTFIQEHQDRSFEIETKDAQKLSFTANEIQNYLSKMEQELLIIETPPLYDLEWRVAVPITDAANGEYFLGLYFDIRKLDLIEGLINDCFGKNVCKASIHATMMPINNHVQGVICIKGINQIISMSSKFLPDHGASIRKDSSQKADVNQEQLLSIINTLKNNISTQLHGRKTLRNSQWKINLLSDIENQLKNPIQDTDINQYVADIRKVCALKRNRFHFWSEPHSLSEFESLINEIPSEKSNTL